MPTKIAIPTVTFDLNDPSMVLPRRFWGKKLCAFALRPVTERSTSATGS
jgi:hypothetical protein